MIRNKERRISLTTVVVGAGLINPFLAKQTGASAGLWNT